MFLSLYDEVTNVLCVSLLSKDRYQYDSLILSSDTSGLPELLPLHKQPVSWNFLLHSQIDCLVGRGLPYSLLKRRCTRVTEFVFANSSTQKAFSTTVTVILLQWCQGRWRCADVTKECLEKNFHLSSALLPNCVTTALTVLILHNVESVYFFYSNPVLYIIIVVKFRAIPCFIPWNIYMCVCVCVCVYLLHGPESFLRS